MTGIEIQRPYLLFLGNAKDQLAAKTAQGILDWRPDWCLGQMRLEGCNADLKIKDMNFEEAAKAGAKALFVETPEEAGEWLAKELRPGDAVLLKASRGVKLERALEKVKQLQGVE